MGRPKTRSRPPKPRGTATDVKPASPGTGYAIFSFQYVDRVHDDGWRWCRGEEWQVVLEFLCEMSRLTWSEIFAQTTGTGKRDGHQHKKHHFQDPSRICGKAQDRLGRLDLQQRFDEDEFFRFRIAAKKRLWGYLRDGVFYVLWWDHDHRVYPNEKD